MSVLTQKKKDLQVGGQSVYLVSRWERRKLKIFRKSLFFGGLTSTEFFIINFHPRNMLYGSFDEKLLRTLQKHQPKKLSYLLR